MMYAAIAVETNIAPTILPLIISPPPAIAFFVSVALLFVLMARLVMFRFALMLLNWLASDVVVCKDFVLASSGRTGIRQSINVLSGDTCTRLAEEASLLLQHWRLLE